MVVPAHRDSPEFRRCLAALQACDPAPCELVVVVDGADPEVGATARAAGAKVIDLDVPGGPARARNVGAAASTAPVLYFVDSDVEVPPDAVAAVSRYLGAHPEVDAIIGSYDAAPPAPGMISQYKNLLNHRVHQQARVEATTFWGACGAVRREAFEGVGGFDQRYTRPCVEDIELGYRLRAAGRRIHVVKGLQVKHLKRWTARSLLRADVLDRAIPWSELIVEREGLTDDLNISRIQRVKVLTALIALTGAAGSVFSRRSGQGAFTAMVVLMILDARLAGFFLRRGGSRFAVVALLWHWSSYLYSAVSFGAVAVRSRARSPAGTGQRR